MRMRSWFVVCLLALSCAEAQESPFESDQTALWSNQFVNWSAFDTLPLFAWENSILVDWFEYFNLESIGQEVFLLAQQQVTTTVKGIVKWPDGKSAIGATVKVRFEDQEVARVYSRQDGSYESSFISMPITGRLTVAVSHPGDIDHCRGAGYANKDIHTGFVTTMDVGLLGPGLLIYRIHNLNANTSLPDGAKIKLRIYPGRCSWDDIQSGRVNQIGYYEVNLEQDAQIIVQISPITVLIVLPRVNGLHWEAENGGRIENLLRVYLMRPCQKATATLLVHLLTGD